MNCLFLAVLMALSPMHSIQNTVLDGFVYPANSGTDVCAPNCDPGGCAPGVGDPEGGDPYGGGGAGSATFWASGTITAPLSGDTLTADADGYAVVPLLCDNLGVGIDGTSGNRFYVSWEIYFGMSTAPGELADNSDGTFYQLFGGGDPNFITIPPDGHWFHMAHHNQDPEGQVNVFPTLNVHAMQFTSARQANLFSVVYEYTQNGTHTASQYDFSNFTVVPKPPNP